MSANKVLLIDIETSPLVGMAWQMYDANILHVLEPVKVICTSWKWLGEPDVHCKALPDFPGYQSNVLDDSQLVKEVWSVLDQANTVCGHNVDSFDLKRLNARFLFHGLAAPSPYRTIDTLKAAKKHFQFDANSLDALGAYLGEGRKEQTGGFNLWLKCMQGDGPAWAQMKKYNSQDVLLLEKIYLRLRPFIVNHPDVTDFASTTHCPSCASPDVEKRGFSHTKLGKKQKYQCKSCFSWSTGQYVKV